MLQLQLKKLDICRISKILVKYNIKASVSNQVITLNGVISDELIDQICNCTTICTIQNFGGEVSNITQDESSYFIADDATPKQVKDNELVVATKQEHVLAPQIIQNYDLIYSEVKRGEVYLCDFGEPYGSEQGYLRYAIVVQNDDGNLHSPTTIVIACTTEYKKELPVHHQFIFSYENMIDYNEFRIGKEKNVVMAEQIHTVDKTRLRKYLGTMTPEFMDKLQGIIDVSLGLTRKEKIVTKTEKVYIDKPVMVSVSNAPKESKDLNMVQMQILALVNIEELFKISQTIASDEIKAQKILELFGFDMQKNGVQYLFKAILISSNDSYFNLETLCENISNDESGIEKNEIKRLIVARVKEQFKFRKSPTIDFIRLVNSFLSKKEDLHNEETNF